MLNVPSLLLHLSQSSSYPTMVPRAAENSEMQILELYASTVNSEGGVQAIRDLSIQVILVSSKV